MEKDELLKLLLEKGIISSTQKFDDLTKPQLEELLENGVNLTKQSLSTEQANAAAIQALKDEFLEDKDTFVKNLAIENKRLKQNANQLVENLKGKMKEMAKFLNEPFK